MNKKYIIKQTQVFNEMIATCAKVANKNYIVFYRLNAFEYNRYGISVGKKIGHAVVRNKFKRQVRAILSSYQKDYPFGVDCIIMIRKSCIMTDFPMMKKQLFQLLNEMKEKIYESKENK